MGARVHLCGRLQVEWDGERLEQALPGRQGRLLFAFLTLHRERPVRRDELVEALWSDEEVPRGGDALLRPPLSRLRSALGPGRLDGRAELAVRFPADTWIDREAVRDGVRRARAARAAGDARAASEAAVPALAIAERGLLPALEARWLEPFRAELEEQRVDLLETVARAGARLADGELPEAEEAARRAVEAAPFRESARVALLAVLRRRGNVAEALLAFDEFRTLLRDELGTSPGPELLALHEDLLHADSRPPPRRPAAPPRGQALPDRLAQAATAPWIGREDALSRLREQADQTAAGRTGVVLVSGEGGIGKTRLIAELAAGLPGFDVLYGRCDEEELFPYGPWVDLLRPRLDRMGEAELAAVLGPEAADLARIVPELRDRVPVAGGDSPVFSDPEVERRQLFVAVTRVVARLAEARPLLTVIDDLHWADRSSLLLARHLAREPRLGPVLMVGTYRDTELDEGHPLPGLIADVERDRPVPRIRLAGMDEREVGALIGSWHGGTVEEAAVRVIREETEGNPFFVKQLVRHLEEVGGRAGLPAGDGLGVPEGVRTVIARRVARLPQRAGQVLRVAALVGRDFDYDLLEAVAGVPADELLDVLDAAVRGGLVAEVPSTPGRYSFAHALLRSAMEAELSATRRALLHKRIGEAIEERHRDRVEPWLSQLARHFAAAGPQEAARAVRYAVRAAERATERLAYDEAVRLLELAAGLYRRDDPVDPAELSGLETALATALANAGRWEAARASFLRAAAAARTAEDGEAFARAALGHSGGTWEQYGMPDPASVALLEEALEQLGDGDLRSRSQVLARLAVVRYADLTRTWEDVRGPADEAVEIARRLGDPDPLIAALAAAQHARWQPGRAQERLALAGELIEIAEGRGRLLEAAEAHLWRACAALELCAGEEARMHYARFGELAEQSRHYQLLMLLDAMRTMHALLVGDYEAGAAGARALLEWEQHAQAHGSAPIPMLLQIHGAQMIAVLNERDELGGLAPLVERMVDEVVGVPGWRAVLAWARVQAGDTALARADLEALSADAFAVFRRDTNFLPSMALTAHAVGELGDAALAARAAPLLEPHRDLWVVFGMGSLTLGPVAYALGVLELVQDRVQDAVATFELAIERSARMQARPYLTRSWAGLAAALRRRGGPGDAARAEELSARAAAEARALGMSRLERELGVTAP